MLAGGGAPPFGIAALSPLRFDRAPFRVSSVPATIGWRGAALQLCLCFSLQRGDPCRADLMNTLPEDLDAARQPVQPLARNLIVTRVSRLPISVLELRSDERRVGKVCVSTFRSQWSP